MAKLTPAQARMLALVEAKGLVVYNGRARRTVEALVALGLVTSEYGQRAEVKGGGITISETFTVRPTTHERNA